MSIETGDNLYLLADGGQYCGFTLVGGRSRIMYKNVIKDPLSVDDFKTQLQRLNEHTQAIEDICSMVEAVATIEDGNVRTLDRAKAAISPRYINTEIRGRPANLIEEIREDLRAPIERLKYSQNYWEKSAKDISNFVARLVTGSDMEDEPMWPSEAVLLNRTNDILRLLSVFGGQAPSIFNGNSAKKVAAPGIEDPNLRIVDKKRVVQYIPFYTKGLIAAAADWQAAKNSTSFKFIPARANEGRAMASAKQRSGVIRDPDFDTFYSNLRQWMHTKIERKVDPGSKKRKTGEMDVDESEAPPQKRVAKAFVFA
jgi:hypothetical protein